MGEDQLLTVIVLTVVLGAVAFMIFFKGKP